MDLYIFDLDGTLIDSETDLVLAVNAARHHMGLDALAPSLVASYVGNGAPVLIRRALGPEAGEGDVQRALDFFIAYYGEHCLENTDLYPGVREALDDLHGRKARMAVLTNKPARISNRIVSALGLEPHFFRVYGGNSFEQKKPHPIGIETLLRETGTARDRTVMVGDSAVDVRTARNAGVLACGVTYGFQPESFGEAPPDFLIGDMRELLARLPG